MDNNLLLPALILVPFIAGFLCWIADKAGSNLPKWIALIGMVITLGLTLILWQSGNYQFDPQGQVPEWAAQFQVNWIPTFGISIHLAIDGMSMLMVALTALLGVMAVGCSWSEIQKNEGFFFLNLLWSLGAVIGVFIAIDMFLFFFFWEMMLVPIYFLIALWGHKGSNGRSRVYAATKFFIYTQVAGLIMLVGILALVIINYTQQLQINPDNARLSFDYMDLLGTQIPHGLDYALMLCFFIGFAVKLPVFPLHGWLPDAHAQAPTAGSVDLAGILIKTAAYGLIRFTIPFFPEASAEFANIAIILGLIGIFYGAWCAYQQTDMKRLLAYTSISHMGFVLLAIYAGNILTYQGLMVMMLAHGLSSAALFIMCGQIYERLHTRDMRLMGGIRGQFRYLPFFLMFFIAALVGIPGLGNFIGEFLILMGSYARYPVFTIIAAVSLVFAGLYGLILIHRSLFGEPNKEQAQHYQQPLKDLSAREIGILMLAVVGLVWLGLYPQTILDISNSSMSWIVNSYLPQIHSVVDPAAVQLNPSEIQ
ncbi:NADH-quinone oxidoreductase subunit M [Acinetobacter qingfengensis]|uniref:NADH-quinone oxidoreductase subunit M n=1 Tax=Acinetobacter qingfengensis TaxID=1262585 RepID=A0A1E7RDG6_9GAMM|nr:NADH-quinone oxidoreductase subunit M [Acinetobacter qingfengensis]KAA8734468.1 NADH-quinone oxidoreductase subunit M [Acinetobacter qingfengensis]OEY97381.1 NADH-quinone oxidoreductase subunit M [Acinetobacter qingfengensis]